MPHLVATAADADGPFYEGAAGNRTAGTDQPLDGGTLFRIASMTKMLATVAALQPAERGELHMQAPVDTLVPRGRSCRSSKAGTATPRGCGRRRPVPGSTT